MSAGVVFPPRPMVRLTARPAQRRRRKGVSVSCDSLYPPLEDLACGTDPAGHPRRIDRTTYPSSRPGATIMRWSVARECRSWQAGVTFFQFELESLRQRALLIIGGREPGVVDLDTPARDVRNGRLPVDNCVGRRAEEALLPRVVVVPFDREFQVFAGISDGAEKVHREDG